MPRTRPCWPLYKSTWIGTLRFAVFLTIIIVPGETQDGGSSGSGASFVAPLHLHHGWPWPYLEHYYGGRPASGSDHYPQFTAFPHRPEWTTSWAWTFGPADVFRPISLLLDRFTAVLLLLLFAGALELRRRRRRLTQWTLARARASGR